MQRLKQMFKKQLELEESLYTLRMGKEFLELVKTKPLDLINDDIYFATEELHEMGRELPFMKFWKTYTPVVSEQIAMVGKAKKEYVDIIHFLINIALVLQINPNSYTIPELTPALAPMQDRCKEIKLYIINTIGLLHSLRGAAELHMQGVLDGKKQFHDFYFKIINNMIAVACLLHMSKNEVYELFMEKNKINHVRQESGY